MEEQLRLVEVVLYNLPWFNLLHQLFTELKLTLQGIENITWISSNLLIECIKNTKKQEKIHFL